MTYSLPCLALVPGLACDHAVWEPVLPALAAQARTWVPIHPPGGSLAERAAAILRDAPAGHFALAGHSMGGRIALEVVRQAPQRVTALALLDTGWQPLPAGEAGEAERTQRETLVALARRDGMRAMGQRWSVPMLHPAHLDTQVHTDVLAMIERQPVEHFATQQQALLARPDAGAVLDSTTCPTLVLCGEQDGWSPPARHDEMARRIRGARLVLVPDCGHMSPMEQPGAVGAALVQWLRAR